MNYGYFDDIRREYVITDPHTPVKWINYIGGLDFGGFVDHTGGALLCKGDPTFNRITKYLQQMPASDFKGETLYLREAVPGGYRVFSPFYVPTLNPYDRYECRVGLGYTCILSEFYGIRTEVVIFVPRHAQIELRRVKVTNLRAEPVQLEAIPAVEFTHPDALRQFTNADWVPQTMQSRAVQEGGLTVLLQYPFMNRDLKVNYFTANLPAASFETRREAFLGNHEYGSWRQPLSLQHEHLENGQAQRGDTMAALLLPLGELGPGESREFVTQLGQDASLEAAGESIRRFRKIEAIDRALEDLRLWWDERLAVLQVETPDPAMNAMLNVHNPHQCQVTRDWSRYLSYYQLGLGSRGIGIRDSSQDLMAVLAADASGSREFLLRLLSFQKQDGSAMHQFNPLTLEGSGGDALEYEDRPHYYSDDHLWLVLATLAYLRESGDFNLLEVEAPFYEKDKHGHPVETASVLIHLRRALSFTRCNTGAHGLPLLGFADWNDTVNLPAGAESLFTAHLYGRALLEMVSLKEYLGESQSARDYRIAWDEMRQRVEQAAWDAEWYLRYFDEKGAALGSHRNTQGQIYLNAQSWAVLSGFASLERAVCAMDSVYTRLNTPWGIKLSAPGFNGYDPHVGGISTYPPGAKENGGIFLHPNPWAMIAETQLGRGERAFQYYSQINPASRNDQVEIYECEPYVYAQNILGDEHPQFGLGRNSWLSGTASWCYQAATQYILGVRPEFGGLRIDPCIPSGWDGFSMIRRFRGAEYHITVHNPEHICQGVRRMLVDGVEANGSLVPLDELGTSHRVEVWLGGS